MDDRTAREAAWDAAIAANGDEGWVSRATVDAAIDAYLAAMKGEGWKMVKREDMEEM